jgi:hypothetical protein
MSDNLHNQESTPFFQDDEEIDPVNYQQAFWQHARIETSAVVYPAADVLGRGFSVG